MSVVLFIISKAFSVFPLLIVVKSFEKDFESITPSLNVDRNVDIFVKISSLSLFVSEIISFDGISPDFITLEINECICKRKIMDCKIRFVEITNKQLCYCFHEHYLFTSNNKTRTT